MRVYFLSLQFKKYTLMVNLLKKYLNISQHNIESIINFYRHSYRFSSASVYLFAF